MRVLTATGVAFAPPQAARPSARGTFTLDVASRGAASGGSPGGVRALGSLDALLALQAVDDRPERRRRAVQRGRLALDALDTLKAELLAGVIGNDALVRVRSAAQELEQGSGDEGLDGILREISLRAQVELAKLGRL